MRDSKTKSRARRGQGHLFQKAKNGPWHLQYYKYDPDKGRKVCVKEYTRLVDRQEAQKLLNDRLAKVARGEQFETGRPRTVAELYKALHTATLTDESPNSRKAKGLGWRWKHLGPIFGAMYALGVTTKRVDEYKLERKAEGAAPATVNRELAVLRRMFRYGKQTGMVQNVPYISLNREDNARRGFVDDETFARMAEEADKEGLWLRTLIEMAYQYGWRRGELVSLHVRQIDPRSRTIRLEPGTTKNKEGREVWMNDKVNALLSALCEGKQPSDFVFTRDNGEPVRDFRAAWQNMCIRARVPGPDGAPSRFECLKCKAPIEAGMKKCRACGGERRYVGLIPHDLRRSAARRLLNAGVDVIDVMKTGGWKGTSMVSRYAIFDRNASRRVMEKLEQHQRTMETAKPLSQPLQGLTPETASGKEKVRVQ